MTRGWRLFLAARGTLPFLVLAAGALAAVLASGVTVFEIRLVDTNLPRFTPAWEAVPVILAVLAPALLAPRLATWELLAGPRIRIRAATIAVAAVVLPAAIPWVAHFHLPDDARWWDIMWNVVLLAGIALIATAALGRIAGPMIGLFVYVAIIAIQQTMPEVAAYLPVSGAKTNLRAHPLPSLIAASIAVGFWTVTKGQSHLTRSLQRND